MGESSFAMAAEKPNDSPVMYSVGCLNHYLIATCMNK